MPRHGSTWRVPDEEVYRAVCDLAGRPRPLVHGTWQANLPGGTATDIGRHLGRYEEAVRPALKTLVDQGRVTLHKIGAARCYTPVEIFTERSA